jgi:ComF family protein
MDNESRLCGACMRQMPPYKTVYRFADYAPPLDRIIQQLKFNQKLHYARLLGGLMANDIRAQGLDLPDVLMPVPLHTQRLKQRGFNQAAEIARILAKSLGLPLDIHSCSRTRPTPEQSGLPAKQRKTNIKGAFQVRGAIKGKHIAILDDVMTTGSTVDELTRVLKNHGAQRVDVWVCARANL